MDCQTPKTNTSSSTVGAAGSVNKQEGQQRDTTHFEEVAGQQVSGSAGSFQEGFPGDGHAHCSKLGEVVDEAVHAFQQAAGQADEQAAPLLLGLLPRTAKPHPTLLPSLLHSHHVLTSLISLMCHVLTAAKGCVLC